MGFGFVIVWWFSVVGVYVIIIDLVLLKGVEIVDELGGFFVVVDVMSVDDVCDVVVVV